MALTHWGFIYTAPGLEAEGHWSSVTTADCRTELVGVASVHHAPEVARQLTDQGVQLIELCGAFGPVSTAKVIEAVDGRVPVGTVAYGPETIAPLHNIFS